MSDPDETPGDYDHEAVESRLAATWAEADLHAHDDDPDRPDYVIDTPPPYPTGNLHVGNALGWCYMDFLARYRRLRGDDVLFPQGWDCHGLPTEVKVEETHDIHRTEVPREEFRRLCVEHTEERIAEMKATMRRLGFSQDWNHEFRTMDPDYWCETQRSFVRMAASGQVYRDEHPVNWCPRCETAIADAEVETTEQTGTLHTVAFPGVDGDGIDIATTRPELLAACVAVAVAPDGEHADRIGDTVAVPLFDRAVEVIGDADVEGGFGTGATMVCTFGDEQDVTWWQRHDLPLRPVLGDDGRLTDAAGEFAGLGVEDAREAVATALSEAGRLRDEASTARQVGVCWRCDTPIEILSTEQWFVAVDTEEVLAHASEVEWVPDGAYERLEEWADGMAWDWVVSRQRVFATPIPVWFCEACEYARIATESELPVDPTETTPDEDCPDCGAREWHGETDVLDTWMDSSISPLYVQGWPDEPFEPVQLREQGHDIIRTWAFYTVLRTAALERETPWETALVNGMVFGEDGRKMSKSRDNFVQPETVVEEHGADAFRQALAVAGRPGADVAFRPKEVTSAARFGRKLWNVTAFAVNHADERTPDVDAPAYRDADAWILSRAAETASEVAAQIEAYRFDDAVRAARSFVWDDLADEYLELVKGRLYNGRPGERDAARHALYTAVTTALRTLAPFAPFITDEAWRQLPTDGSVHESSWPDPPRPEGADRGGLVARVAAAVRGWKSERGIPLNGALDRVDCYPDDVGAAPDTYDLSNATNAPVRVESGMPAVESVAVGLDPDPAVLGPRFRERAVAVAEALESMDPDAAAAALGADGELTVTVDGEPVTVGPDAVTVHEELRTAAGDAVAVLDVEGATVLVHR